MAENEQSPGALQASSTAWDDAVSAQITEALTPTLGETAAFDEGDDLGRLVTNVVHTAEKAWGAGPSAIALTRLDGGRWDVAVMPPLHGGRIQPPGVRGPERIRVEED